MPRHVGLGYSIRELALRARWINIETTVKIASGKLQRGMHKLILSGKPCGVVGIDCVSTSDRGRGCSTHELIGS